MTQQTPAPVVPTVQRLRSSVLAALGSANVGEIVGDGFDMKLNKGKEQDDGSFRFTVTITPPFVRDGDLTNDDVRSGKARPGETVEANPLGLGFAEFKVAASGRTNYTLVTPNGSEITVPFGDCKAVEQFDAE